jgi:hypothetical protein
MPSVIMSPLWLYAEYHYAECRYADCRGATNAILRECKVEATRLPLSNNLE